MKLVPMHSWFAVGTIGAYLAIPRTSWYLDEKIQSVDNHRKKNLL